MLSGGVGSIVATYEYDVFGVARSSPDRSTEYGFTGQQDDTDAARESLHPVLFSLAFGADRQSA